MQRIMSDEQRGPQPVSARPCAGRALKSAGFVTALAGASKPLLRAIPVQRTSERDQGGSGWSETALGYIITLA
jgi:hypothetical protein